MKRIDKINFGSRVASKVDNFEYGVLFAQEGLKAMENNKFRKFIQEFGFTVAAGNGVMKKALEVTKFNKLYANVKGAHIAAFFNDKDCIQALNIARRKFSNLKLSYGFSNGYTLSKELLDGLGKIKNVGQLYINLCRALTTPFRRIIEALEKRIENGEEGSNSNIEEVQNLLNKLSLRSIHNVACKILKSVK